MFLDFFILLKNDGLPVSLREYLAVLEALDKGVVEYNVDDFYFLSRTGLIKREEHLDRFDLLFGEFFKGLETLPNDIFMQFPEEWLKRNQQKLLSQEEKDQIKALGGWDALMERLKKLMEEQKKRHEGGNKWIGTGGTSPFGAGGYHPEGFRFGPQSAGNRTAIKVWDKREFRNLDENVEIDTRNLKMGLRKLRHLTREGNPAELDLKKTIRKTSENAGFLDIQMVASRKNNVKVLLLLDIGGSMDDHIDLCARLFSAARYEFKHLEYFYFHNCVYEKLWKDNKRRWGEGMATYELLNTYNSDYKVIFVGDASMSPYEILYRGGSVEHMNDEPGITWLDRLKEQFPSMAWLNPVPEQYWEYTTSIGMIQNFMRDRMFPLTLEGLDKAVSSLKKTRG